MKKLSHKTNKNNTKKVDVAHFNKLVVFQAKDGAIELKGDLKSETVWASLDQISTLFGRDKSSISRHIKNIFKEEELLKEAVVAKNATVQKEGAREVSRDIEYYNLDMILSVGYRVNSKVATGFRIWATKVLKQYVTKGFAMHKQVIKRNLDLFLEDIKPLLPVGSVLSTDQLLEISSIFADTWLSLDEYDKDKLEVKKPTKKNIKLTAGDLLTAIYDLKSTLMKRGEASELFAVDKSKNSLEGIVGNIMQSFGGKNVYESVEEKAAHLLYFVVKNHPFVDGNKRSGAFAFVWFLQKCKRLDLNKINPTALTLITLLVAESNPNHKEKVVKLVMKLIAK